MKVRRRRGSYRLAFLRDHGATTLMYSSRCVYTCLHRVHLCLIENRIIEKFSTVCYYIVMHAPENELHSIHTGMTQIEKHRPPYRHVAPKLTLSYEHCEYRRRPYTISIVISPPSKFKSCRTPWNSCTRIHLHFF